MGKSFDGIGTVPVNEHCSNCENADGGRKART